MVDAEYKVGKRIAVGKCEETQFDCASSTEITPLSTVYRIS